MHSKSGLGSDLGITLRKFAFREKRAAPESEPANCSLQALTATSVETEGSPRLKSQTAPAVLVFGSGKQWPAFIWPSFLALLPN